MVTLVAKQAHLESLQDLEVLGSRIIPEVLAQQVLALEVEYSDPQAQLRLSVAPKQQGLALEALVQGLVFLALEQQSLQRAFLAAQTPLPLNQVAVYLALLAKQGLVPHLPLALALAILEAEVFSGEAPNSRRRRAIFHLAPRTQAAPLEQVQLVLRIVEIVSLVATKPQLRSAVVNNSHKQQPRILLATLEPINPKHKRASLLHLGALGQLISKRRSQGFLARPLLRVTADPDCLEIPNKIINSHQQVVSLVPIPIPNQALHFLGQRQP